MTGLVELIAVPLIGAGVWAAVHGARLVGRAVRHGDDTASSLWLIRGIRALVVAVATWSLAGGVLFTQTWLLVFGGVFLAEELYETGIVIAILRWSPRAAGAARGPAHRAPVAGGPFTPSRR
jgi:hypothetical protein